MDSFIYATDAYAAISAKLKAGSKLDQVTCDSEQVFALAKSILVKEKIGGVTVTLVDPKGTPIRQVTSKRRAEPATEKPAVEPTSPEQLTERQLVVVSALEKVLMHCKREGLQLIGYSDALVVLPSNVADEEVSSANAYEIDTGDCYRGADEIQPDLEIE